MEIDYKEQIEKLNRIGIALSAEHNLDKLLELIVTESRAFTNSDAGSLYIKEGDELTFVVTQNETLWKRLGKDKEPFKPFKVPITKKSFSGYVTITGEILNIPDVYAIPEGAEYSAEATIRFDEQMNLKTTSMLVVPMRDYTDEIIGVLQLINAMDGDGNFIPYDKDYEDLVLSLASQAAVAISNTRLIKSIKNLFDSLVVYSATAIDARSPHTAGHSRRVAQYSTNLAKKANEVNEGPLKDIYFTPEEIEELNYSAWLHDMGKIGVPEHVLEKANRLSDDGIEVVRQRFNYMKKLIKENFLEKKISLLENNSSIPENLEKEYNEKIKILDKEIELIEQINKSGFLHDEKEEELKKISVKAYFEPEGNEQTYLKENELENLSVKKGNLTKGQREKIQSHVQHTLTILEKIPFTEELENIPVFAAAHHEMLNGTGYPNQLTAEQITLQSRILAVVDIFDALTAHDRPYKPSVPLEKTIEILKAEVKDGRLDGDLTELFINEKLYEGVK